MALLLALPELLCSCLETIAGLHLGRKAYHVGDILLTFLHKPAHPAVCSREFCRWHEGCVMFNACCSGGQGDCLQPLVEIPGVVILQEEQIAQANVQSGTGIFERTIP